MLSPPPQPIGTYSNSVLQKYNPFDIWEESHTVTHNGCCHVQELTKHTLGDVSILSLCMIQKLAGTCWNLALLSVHLHVHMRAYVCMHTLQCQTCREGKHLLRWEDSSGWKRGGLEQLSLCAGFCDECGSPCAIWCPSVMVGILWSSKAFCVVDTTQHRTVDLMLADSLSHCWYSKPGKVSKGGKGKFVKVSCIWLHYVHLYLYGLCSVI